MSLDRAVLLFAGFVVLLGIALSLLVHPWWLALSAFAGFNLIQSSFTGFCPAAIVFRKLGARPGVAFK
ncbi:MAG: YgaP family membrane protein [Polymorphobacter sp.]